MPLVKEEETNTESVIAIVFYEGVVIDNREFKRVSFDIMVYVPLSEWILNDINLRPFLIMSEIEKSLKNKRIESLGTIDYKGFEVKVGSGFTDQDRDYFWDNQKDLLGRVITVQYFEETTNKKDNSLSLRFPVYLELREPGKEVSYY